MKKLILSILFIICLSIQASAWNPMVVVSGSSAESPCPSYYADAILSWDGDHTTDAYTGCDSAGDPVTFTGSGTEDIGTYGQSSSMALKISDTDDWINYTQTAQQYVDETGAQTICMIVNLSAIPDNIFRYTGVYEAGAVDDELYAISSTTANNFAAISDAQGQTANISNSYVLGYGAYKVVGISWYVNAGDDLSANPGDEGTWDNGWERDNDTLEAYGSDLVEIYIGCGGRGLAVGDTETAIIDDWAVFDGYEVDCSLHMVIE